MGREGKKTKQTNPHTKKKPHVNRKPADLNSSTDLNQRAKHTLCDEQKGREKENTHFVGISELGPDLQLGLYSPHCNPCSVILKDVHYQFPTRRNASSPPLAGQEPGGCSQESSRSIVGSTKAQGCRVFTLKPCRSLCKDKTPSCQPCRDPCSGPWGEGLVLLLPLGVKQQGHSALRCFGLMSSVITHSML